jgi:hypothetical protein
MNFQQFVVLLAIKNKYIAGKDPILQVKIHRKSFLNIRRGKV